MYHKLSADDKRAALNIADQIGQALHLCGLDLVKLRNTDANVGYSPAVALASQMLWAKRERERLRGIPWKPTPYEDEKTV